MDILVEWLKIIGYGSLGGLIATLLIYSKDLWNIFTKREG